MTAEDKTATALDNDMDTSSSIKSNNRGGSLLNVFSNKKSAFATMICDLKMLEPTMVSLYSLNSVFAKKLSSKQDVIVLLPESIQVESEDVEKLEKLGAQVIRTSFPQASSSDGDVCNTVINLFALFDYSKIVYFTPDIIFNNNVDQLLNYPVGSALANSLYILEPNPNSFESLVRALRKSSNATFPEVLEQTLDKYSYVSEKDVVNYLQLFSGPMKPWNFHAYSDVDWQKQWDPVGFYNWRRLNNDMRRLFNPETDWANAPRQQLVCDSYLTSVSDPQYFPVQDQFSVLISTYNPERIEHLNLIIQHLLKSPYVHTVFVTWHNPQLAVPDTLYADLSKTDYSRVKVLVQDYDSLNNRFNPVDQLVTDSVYIMDDDVFVPLDDLEFTFNVSSLSFYVVWKFGKKLTNLSFLYLNLQVWRGRKDSVVGHFPRYHAYNPVTLESVYKLIGSAPYSIVLTKSMFIRSEYLFAYTCLLEPKLHEMVDRQLNCEDLGFSMMACGISRVPATFVRPEQPMEDFGLKKGISVNGSHMPNRAQCIADFITLFWDRNDPLVYNYDIAQPFRKAVINTGEWERVKPIIKSERLNKNKKKSQQKKKKGRKTTTTKQN
ncbi:glycosyl transferase family 64 domain-containing protein [Mycotypha africana]|uniref:glycosyl transferase family 64 domain-containing protein n=1 Tax=Mycotypha africana TaxID=64632 RepID=UPI002301256E|nr:glycosyl transferase family 64 domain-containing protein [Mycotypha africana]KAI8991268.1 glycosyl transferase family 64 domain-containing protein [Mycotypha africana]